MPNTGIPQTTIEKDHDLEGKATRTTEALAKHRWHHTLDPDGPQYSIRSYADAVGRQEATIRRHAKGYAMYVARATGATPGVALSLEDAFRLSEQSAEQQEFSEAIAEGLGEPVGRVARGDNAHRRNTIIGQARDRAARRGTDPVDEAREIAIRTRRTRDMNSRHRQERARRTPVRFTIAEGKLAKAKRAVLDAMRELEGVDLSAEEMELMRGTIGNLTSLLHLLDMRMAGNPNIDWDGELARLSGDAS